MQPRLTRPEYWLLETAVDSGTPLNWLCAENYQPLPDGQGIEGQFNKLSHGLNRQELIQTLLEMFRSGWIEARRDEQIIPMNSARIEAAVAESGKLEIEERTCYWLTKLGGSVWEAFAAPNWEWYLDEDFDPESKRGTLTCMTEWRLRYYLEHFHLAWLKVDPASVKHFKIGEWEAMYWKSLPYGLRVEFRCIGDLESTRVNTINDLAAAGLFEFRDGWYQWQ